MTGGTDRLGDAFEGVAQRPQVHVPVDATELLAGLDHPRGAPAQRHGAVAPVLDVARVRAADRDHALHRVRRTERAGERGWDGEAEDGEGLDTDARWGTTGCKIIAPG